MIQLFKTFFEPASHKSVTKSSGEIQKHYRKYRLSVFLSATLGYSLFYVCRLSISVAKKPMIDAGIFTESELGKIGAALFFSYAFGKLVNGFFTDRININRFMTMGLIMAALCNLALGFFPSFLVFLLIWGLNGWFQSIGAAPSVVALTRWFSSKERGTYYGIWSTSHNIGKAITFTLLPLLIGAGGWKWGFWGASIIGVIGAIIVYLFLHDSPESKGLPSVEDKKEDTEDMSVAASQKKVLTNPYIWILAIASMLMYVSRYAIESWGIFYSQVQKGYTNVQAGEIIALTAITGIIGTAISGIISDKFFKGSRNIPALVAGIINVISISIFLFYPDGNFWMDATAMLLHGFAIGILITFVGGLMAVDIAPKQATGATMGLIGIASYAGAGIQELISGFLISDKKVIINNIATYDFSIARYFWFGAALLSTVITLMVWNAKMQKQV